MQVSQAIAALADYNRGQLRSDKTVAFYSERLMQFALYVGPSTDLQSVTRERVRDFMTGLPGRYSPETARATMVAVKRLFGWAEAEGILPASPIASLRLPTAKGTERPALTPEQANDLLRAFPDTASGRRWRTMALLAIDTGLRVSELCSLRITDLREGRIEVHHGKGQKDRIVFMGQRTQSAVDGYLKRDRKGKGDWLWLGPQGSRVKPSNFRRALGRAGEKTGVHVHPHMLRRTFATILLRHGGDLFSLQELMGHATIGTTRRYVQPDEQRLMSVHAKAGPGDLL